MYAHVSTPRSPADTLAYMVALLLFCTPPPLALAFMSRSLAHQVASLSVSDVSLTPGEGVLDATISLDVGSFDDLRNLIYDEISPTVRFPPPRLTTDPPPL